MMNIKFALFHKSDKTYWSINRIIYSITFFCIGVLFFKEYFLQSERNIIDKIFQLILILTLIFGIITKIKGFTEIEPLHGDLDGYLFFEKDLIRAKDEVFQLEMIRNMQISNTDEYGKLVNTSKGNFGPALSNGTRNHIMIFLESGKTRKFQFELLDIDDFQKIRRTLIGYHLKSKIDIWELAKVLGENGNSSFRELNTEVKSLAKTNNV